MQPCLVHPRQINFHDLSSRIHIWDIVKSIKHRLLNQNILRCLLDAELSKNKIMCLLDVGLSEMRIRACSVQGFSENEMSTGLSVNRHLNTRGACLLQEFFSFLMLVASLSLVASNITND